MKFTAHEIADMLDGNVIGDNKVGISKCAKIENASTGALTFLANSKYEQYLDQTGASAILVEKGRFSENIKRNSHSCTLIEVEDPYLSFTKVLELFNQTTNDISGVHPTAVIGDSVKIGKNVYIGPYAVIESNTVVGENSSVGSHCWIGTNVQIGEDSRIHARVSIYEDTIVGNRCEIKSGAVIGSAGFGFAPQQGEPYRKVPQVGNVIIKDDVNIGANTAIDRATMGSTIIDKGVKLDNLVMIAHNVVVGENTVIAAQSGLSGSSSVGSNCVLGGQVGLIGHIKLGNKVRVQGQSGVTKNVADNTDIQGTPAFEFTEFYKAYAKFRRLPEIEKRLTEIEKKID